MARAQGQPLVQDSNLLAEWSPDQVVDEDEYDGDYEPKDEEPEDEDLEYDSDPDHDEIPTNATPGGQVDNPSTKQDNPPSTPNGDEGDDTPEDSGDDNAQHVVEPALQHPIPQDETAEDQGAPGRGHDHTESHEMDHEEGSHDEVVFGSTEHMDDGSDMEDGSDSEDEDSRVGHGYNLR